MVKRTAMTHTGCRAPTASLETTKLPPQMTVALTNTRR